MNSGIDALYPDIEVTSKMWSATGEWNGSGGSSESSWVGIWESPRMPISPVQRSRSPDVASHRAGLLAIARVSGRSRPTPSIAEWKTPDARLAFIAPASTR